MVDVKKFEKDLVDGGMDKKAAAAKVKEWVTKIRAKHGEDVSDDKIASIITQHLIKMKLKSESGEEFTGVCVGYGRKIDRNSKIFKETEELVTKATKTDALPADIEKLNKALADGSIITVEDNDTKALGYVPVDKRQFIDKKGTIENFGYDKPYRPKIERTAYFIIDEEIVTVIGNFDCQQGREYKIYGKKNNNLLRVGKAGISSVRTLTQAEVWELLYNVAAEDDRACDINGFPSKKPYEFGITNAFVKSKMRCANGSWKVTLYDAENTRGVGGFANNKDAEAVIELANVGDEVIALFTQGVAKGQYDPSPSFVGIFANPVSGEDSCLDDEVEIVEE